MRNQDLKHVSALFVIFGVCLLASAGTARADRLSAFAETGYNGSGAIFRDAVPDLTTAGSPKIASVRGVIGRWLLCAGVNFSGDCVWLSRDVPSLPDFGFTDAPGSLRPESVPIIERHWGNRRPAARDKLVLFDRPGYDGDWIAVSDSVQDFEPAHLKSPGSIVLGDGVWRLCTGPGYTGRCLIVTASVGNLQEVFPGLFHSAQRHAPGVSGWAAPIIATTPQPAQPPASLKCRNHKVPTQVTNKAHKIILRCAKPAV